MSDFLKTVPSTPITVGRPSLAAIVLAATEGRPTEIFQFFTGPETQEKLLG